MPGSEPKSNPLLVRGGRSGRSTPRQGLPPSPEKSALMGRRSISLAPATIWLGLLGFMAIEVSLWGPASLLASTFGPTVTLWVFPGLARGTDPGAETNCRFDHQLGSLELPAAAR